MHNVKLINSNYLMLRTALIINGLKFVASITIMSKHFHSGQANLEITGFRNLVSQIKYDYTKFQLKK